MTGTLRIVLLLIITAAPSAWLRADQSIAQSRRQATLTPLAVVGFDAAAELDERDQWMPTAIEEMLGRRLRRVPGLTVIPNARAHQARRELAESGAAPLVEWQRVIAALGGKLWLRGTCAGTPAATVLDLKLIDLARPDAEPVHTRCGPGRLFDALDEATQWVLQQQRVTRLDDAIHKLVFAPPAASPSALQYYAKALTAARAEDLRNAAYYGGQALEYDGQNRPALLLMAKLELRGSRATRRRAVLHLRQMKELATASADSVDEGEFELARGLLDLAGQSFEPARQRFESALSMAHERDDPYGQIDAMSALSDLWLSMQPPPRSQASAEALRTFKQRNLGQAAEWQRLVLDMLAQAGDVVAEAPAANKLAMIHERLEQPEQALEMHQRTVAAARKSGSARNEATGLLFLGQWYRRHERWQEALDATTRCLALAQDDAKPRVRITLAEIYRAMPRLLEALGQYESAYEALADGEDLLNQCVCLRAIAELKMELGERAAAIQKMEEALDIAHALELQDEPALRKQLDEWKKAAP